MQTIQIGRIYRHFKGDYYLVEAVAKDSEVSQEYRFQLQEIPSTAGHN